MKLTVNRQEMGLGFTIGELLLDGAFECWTLEDTVHSGPKIDGETAIPAGTYKLTITASPRFGRYLPLVNDVPGFNGIRIHPGNTAADTHGCLLVGDTRLTGSIGQSRAAFDRLFKKLEAAIQSGDSVEITYV